MKTLNRALLIAAAALAAGPLAAQDVPGGGVATPADTGSNAAAVPITVVTVGSPAAGGIGQFEAPKQGLEFNGLTMQIGGAFAQTFQALDHENTATPAAKTVLGEIRPGFSLANANLNIGVQLARGIRVDLENYMASRHHNEFWVKGGFATIDASPYDVPVLNASWSSPPSAPATSRSTTATRTSAAPTTGTPFATRSSRTTSLTPSPPRSAPR
jgi:hypothetical protein